VLLGSASVHLSVILTVTSGDACHPMLPYLAQGANSSLEDGAVLGRLLRYVKSEEQILPAVKMYESLRKVRSEAIAGESMKQVFGLVPFASDHDSRLADEILHYFRENHFTWRTELSRLRGMPFSSRGLTRMNCRPRSRVDGRTGPLAASRPSTHELTWCF
jgi:2-polyprenyl-6-methoxyphenol hydroxylase-like FAD-dependent oxidoreductase